VSGLSSGGPPYFEAPAEAEVASILANDSSSRRALFAVRRRSKTSLNCVTFLCLSSVSKARVTHWFMTSAKIRDSFVGTFSIDPTVDKLKRGGG
jgi:hypothetical protein